MAPRYVAFFSYTHDDDEHDEGLLSGVRGRLESELRVTVGDRDVAIFQDRDDIALGEVWEARLAKALDEAVYLIPVITPLFFNSDFCRGEFLKFWNRSQADPENARILPLYWRTHFPIDGIVPSNDDPIVQAVKALQYADWRQIRPLGLADLRMRTKIEAMAYDLALRYAERRVREAQTQRRVGAQGLVANPVVRTRANEVQTDRDGRILVDAAIVTNADGRWFRPGGGPVEWFKDHEHGPDMVIVPAGNFVRGSPESEPERFPDESPQSTVTFQKPFAVGRHAITRGEFATFVHSSGYKVVGGSKIRKGHYRWDYDPNGSWQNPGFVQDDSHPVVCVNWTDAKAYTVWLTELTGKTYRLLSEAEREYVTRAGTTTPFWWGSSITPQQANYNGDFVYKGGGSKGEWPKSTVPVGSFAVNPWGLYNVHGNVLEWCEDAWHDNYDGAPTDGSAWAEVGDEIARVVRGGSWDIDPRRLRSANRNWSATFLRSSGIGFRVARPLDNLT